MKISIYIFIRQPILLQARQFAGRRLLGWLSDYGWGLQPDQVFSSMYLLSHDNSNFDKIKVTFAGITKSERRENVASWMDDDRNEEEANAEEARHDNDGGGEARHDKDGGGEAEQEGDREDHPADEEENEGDLVVEDLEDG